MSPGRTAVAMVGPWGLEHQTSTVSIPRREKHGPARRSSKLHRKTRLDRAWLPSFAHGTALEGIRLQVPRKGGLRHKVRHNLKIRMGSRYSGLLHIEGNAS